MKKSIANQYLMKNLSWLYTTYMSTIAVKKHLKLWNIEPQLVCLTFLKLQIENYSDGYPNSRYSKRI